MFLGTGFEFAHTSQNLTSRFDNGVQRTTYQGHVQDKIDLLNNTLHLTSGVTLQTSNPSLLASEVLGAAPTAADAASAYRQTYGCSCGPYKTHKWDRTWLRSPSGVSLYASYGTSALFAPIGDYGPNAVPGAGLPNASIVHMHEAGIKYNRRNLTLSLDYFNQHVERDFGFFHYRPRPFAGSKIYTNDGQREFKGFEAARIWQATPHWHPFDNVFETLVRFLKTALASVTVQQNQSGLAIRGAPITDTPDWASTFGVQYDHHDLFLPRDELYARFEGQYTGSSRPPTTSTATSAQSPASPTTPAATTSPQARRSTIPTAARTR